MSLSTPYVSNTPTPATNTNVGINISKPGYNALHTSGSNLVYSSSWPTLQYPFEINAVGEPMPNSPYKFSVYRNSAFTIPVNSLTTVVFDTKSFDSGSNYSVSTGLFTAPVSGYYFFTSTIGFVNAGSDFTAQLQKNGSTVKNGNELVLSSGGYGASVSGFIQLSVGDTVNVGIYISGGATGRTGFNTYFDGFLVSS